MREYNKLLDFPHKLHLDNKSSNFNGKIVGRNQSNIDELVILVSVNKIESKRTFPSSVSFCLIGNKRLPAFHRGNVPKIVFDLGKWDNKLGESSYYLYFFCKKRECHQNI